MKNSIVVASILAALSLGTILNAQNLAMPKETGANLTFQFGPTYMNAKSGFIINNVPSGSGKVDYSGMSAAFGWRINRLLGIQIEGGILGASKSATWTGQGYSASVSEDDLMIPLLFSYNVFIPLTKTNRCEFRITPTWGAVYLHSKLNVDMSNGSTPVFRARLSDSWTLPAFGLGIGFRCHVGRKVFLDFAYRGLGLLGDMEMNFLGSSMKLHPINSNSLSASVGFKF